MTVVPMKPRGEGEMTKQLIQAVLIAAATAYAASWARVLGDQHAKKVLGKGV